jgi:phosphatidate cytidylyltransferase
MTGIAFLVIMIAGILASELSTQLLFAIIVTVAGYEYGRMTRCARPQHMAIIALTFYYGMSGASSAADSWYPFLVSGLIALIPVRGQRYFSNLGLRIAGMILIAASFAFLKSELIAGPERLGILAFFGILWISDTMAYVFGRTFGKHKLWPRVSPGKTWEGFIGALISAAIAGYFIYGYLGESPLFGVVVAILICVFGTLGDLLESSLKRKAGVKDSGYFMPGHGGMMDRFDGVMLAAPVVYCFHVLLGAM